MAFSGPDSLPPDVYPDSRNRLPLVQRDELDAVGQEVYDQAVSDARSLAGLHGPGGLRLRAPRLAALMRPLSLYLRFEAGLDPGLAEIATLATARETDQDFEWNAHERIALKVGVAPTVIDVIRQRGPVDGVEAKAAALIVLAREAIGAHHVRSETFASALRLFGAEQLVLYVALMGHYGAIAYLLHTFDNQLPAGEVSRLPATPPSPAAPGASA